MQLVRSIYDRWERGEFTSVDWAHPEIRYSAFDDFSVRETHDRGANVFEIRDGMVVRPFLYADRGGPAGTWKAGPARRSWSSTRAARASSTSCATREPIAGETIREVSDYADAVEQVVERLRDEDRLEHVDAVVHRVVHGGTHFPEPAVIDDRRSSASGSSASWRRSTTHAP